MSDRISRGRAALPGKRRAIELAVVTAIAALAAGPLAAQTVLAPTPYSFDTTYGRLPKNVVPLDYKIAVVPDIVTKTLRGEETVTLNVREATSTIQFNTLNLKLDHVLFDGKAVAAVVTSDEQQLTTVTTSIPAATAV